MDKLAKAWRRHRIRMGREREIPALEAREAIDALEILPGHVTTRDVVRVGYYEILIAAAAVVLDAESHDVPSLPRLLVASGAVS